MKQKLLILTAFITILISGMIPTDVFAASASVYISPSGATVTKGNSITIGVRVNSGSSPMDSVQASLNFSSSKLQYLSYSGGSFTTFTHGLSGSTFSYVGAILGGSTSSDKQMFSVTFKAIASGTAYLSLSGASVAYQGTALSISGVGSGSVNITNPTTTTPVDSSTPTTSSTPSTSSSAPSSTTTSSTSAEKKDTTTP